MIEISYTITGIEELERKLGTDGKRLLEAPMREFFDASLYELEREVKKQLGQGKGWDTGNLAARIGEIHNIAPESLPLWGRMGTIVSYAPYVEADTRPHWTSVKYLVDWAHRHNINPYALQRKIARYGTKGVRMFERGLMSWVYTLKEGRLASLARRIEDEYRKG